MNRILVLFIGLLGLLPATEQALTNQPRPRETTLLDSVAALRMLKIEDPTTAPVAYLAGYYQAGDAGGGCFRYDKDASASDDSGSIIAPLAGAGRWLRVMSGPCSVKWWGAKGDGLADDSAAISNAIAWMVANGGKPSPSNGALYFPAGIYLVSKPAILSHQALPRGAWRGLSFYGDGMFTSVIRCAFTAPGWLFDNEVSSTHYQQVQFENLGFEGMEPAKFTPAASSTNGFKMTGNAAEQGLLFKFCRFQYFRQAFEFDGRNNASEVKFIGCKFTCIAATVYTVNNPQSFNHEFVSTDIEQCYGDIFSVATGGAIKFYGGSVIMFPDGTKTERWFLHITGGSGIGAYPFTFNGIRFEFRGDYANVLKIADLVQVSVAFDHCLLELQAKVTKAAFCTVGTYAIASFQGCDFYEFGGGRMNFTDNGNHAYGENGCITFDHCGLEADLSDRCSATGSFGAIRAMNCHGLNVGAVKGDINHWAADFDLHGDTMSGSVDNWPSAGAALVSGGSPVNGALHLKTAYLKLPTDYWTIAGKGANEQTLKLPRNAIIKNIYLLKPSGGTDTSKVSFAVGNNDKSIVHLKTPAKANNVAQKISLSDYFYSVGTKENDRTLRLFCLSGNPQGTTQGGFIIVEYY